MLQLEVVTPKGPKLKTEASQVTAPGTLGDLGILPGHRPLLSSLGIGEFSYTTGGETRFLAVNGGYVEVADDQVIVITETAELPEEIDVDRAKAALGRAEERLKELGAAEPEALKLSIAAQKRAEARLALTKRVKPKRVQ